MENERGKIRAALFDLDGTLVDSEPLHFAAFVRAAKQIRIAPPRGLEGVLGLSDAEAAARLTSDATLREELVRRKRAAFLRSVPKELRATRGAAELLAACGAASLRIAVVTNAGRDEAESALGAAGLRNLIPLIVADGDSPRPKPAPDPYVTALSALGVLPAEALAYEDSAAGIASAIAAGVEVVRVGRMPQRGSPGVSRAIVDFVGEAERLLG